MTEETAAPIAPEAPASIDPVTEKNKAIDEDANAGVPEPPPKPEKTPEERRIAQLQRAVDRKTRQLAEIRAREALTRERSEPKIRETADDNEPVSLTRAELQELVTAEAQKLAPTLSDQANEAKRRTGVVDGLAKTWGQEKFNELASDLDDAFGGLADSAGRPRPATEAVFESDDPKAVIEFLADPDNLDEAERISRLSAVQAGKAIAKLEAQLEAKKHKEKPRASNAPAPLEAIKGAGPAKKALADLTGDDFDRRRREQIANR